MVDHTTNILMGKINKVMKIKLGRELLITKEQQIVLDEIVKANNITEKDLKISKTDVMKILKNMVS